MLSPTQESTMKSTSTNGYYVQPHSAPGLKHSTLTPEENEEQRQHDKEFICAMNEIVATHGALTDDDFFKVL